LATRAQIEEFLALPVLAVVGASRSREKYGFKVFRDLLQKGYRVYPVNSHADEIDGHKTCRDVAGLPGDVRGLVLVVPPEQTERVVRDAHAAGIHWVWMQPGAESEEAVRYCARHGLTAIVGVCLLMEGPGL
jgi:hypothetical protein